MCREDCNLGVFLRWELLCGLFAFLWHNPFPLPGIQVGQSGIVAGGLLRDCTGKRPGIIATSHATLRQIPFFTLATEKYSGGRPIGSLAHPQTHALEETTELNFAAP